MLVNQPTESRFVSLKSRLAQLEDFVFKKRPVLGNLYRQNGDLSLLAFAKRQWNIPDNEFISQQKKTEIIDSIAQLAGQLLGTSIERSISQQLNKLYGVITSDHHGPLTDPGFFNSNLLFGLNAQSIPYQENIIVISCSNVSFDNESFPRGHLLHTIKENTFTMNQLPLFPSKVRPLPVFRHPGFTKENINALMKRVIHWRDEGMIKQQQQDKLNFILNTIYSRSDVLSLQSFSEQVTKTNFTLWNVLVNGKQDMPNLIYLDQEQIVLTLLMKYHLRKKTMIHQLLFDPNCHDLLSKYFENIPGGLSLKNGHGTFLFWGLPPNQKYRLPLRKHGNALVSFDNEYRVELTPHSLQKAMSNGELIPSTLLCYILLAFYYGLTLFGGGAQTTYLTQMKNAYIKLLKEYKSRDEILTALAVETDHQCMVYPSLAFLTNDNDTIVPATPLDIFLHDNNNYREIMIHMAQTVTVKQALARALPQMARSLVGQNTKQNVASYLTENEIDSLTDFQREPCSNIFL